MRQRATRLSATGANGRRAPTTAENAFKDAAAFLSMRIPAGSNYAGPLVQVRRSSDSATQDIGAGAPDANGDRWLDTAALLSFVGGGNGFVTTWYDQAGGERNAIQDVAAIQPRLVTAGVVEVLGGRPAIAPSGTGYLFWSVLYRDDHTVSFVALPSPAGSGRYMLSSAQNAGNIGAVISGYNAPFEWFTNPRFVIQSQQTLTRAMVTSQDGGTAIGYVDNVQTGAGAVTTNLNLARSNQLFAVNAQTIFQGRCSEIAIFNSVVSTNQRADIFASQLAAYP